MALIGADYEKIHFVLFDLNLVEPMAFVTDTLVAAFSIVFAFKLIKLKTNHPFRSYWIWFFLVFGVGAFVGGLGHVFFQQWGVAGKFPSWLAGPMSIFLLEQGMIAAEPNEKKLNLYKVLSFWKMVLVYGIFTLICISAPISEKPGLPFLPIAINTIIGVTLTAGLLGRSLSKRLTIEFKYFVFGVIVMLPTAFIFLMKINLHQWFDKNDLSHILMIVGITYFYFGAKRTMKLFM